MNPPPLKRERLTGRTWARTGLLRPVLRVEVAIEMADAIESLQCPPPPKCPDPDEWRERERIRAERAWKEIRTYWRDARNADIPKLYPEGKP